MPFLLLDIDRFFEGQSRICPAFDGAAKTKVGALSKIAFMLIIGIIILVTPKIGTSDHKNGCLYLEIVGIL